MDSLRRPQRGVSLVLGTGERARQLAAHLEAQNGGPRIAGFLDDDASPVDRALLGPRYLGTLDDLPEQVRAHGVSRVVFALPRRYLGEKRVANAIAVCELLRVELTIPLDLFDTRIASVVRTDLFGIPAVTHSVSAHRTRWGMTAKRLVDVIVSASVVLLLLPVFLGVSIAILIDSPGSVLFVQERCGLRGRPFPFLKFRTMVERAEERLIELRARNELVGPVFKMERDPRVTRVGAWLRRYSLDELPQLLNVLLGQMSLVGPRPPIPEEVARYQLDHVGRLSMRPGITGLWQASGRNEIPFEDWVKLDLEYVERWSLLLDLKILIATVPAVLSGRGAS